MDIKYDFGAPMVSHDSNRGFPEAYRKVLISLQALPQKSEQFDDSTEVII